ncbi:MAG: tetratricopeptide repeat protein [Verrucomicrobia subdivision 3 bacterium]|nr:tetratricopeptide repeat protein [Limisphaerales bacterium]
MNPNRTLSLILFALLALSADAASKREKAAVPATAPMTFAPFPQEHELASIWNDPDFARRLYGSYGFLSEAEPRLNAEEHQFYTNKIVPLLREDPKKAIPLLESRAKPGTSAQFDYLLGTIYFQNEDLTNAVKHFEAALVKFPDYRRAQKNLAFALVRDGKYADAIKPLTRTIALGAADGKVFGLLGFSYMNQGRYVSAEGAYRQALVFEPDNVDFKLGLVKCSVATANYDHALALLEELIRQYPERDNLWTLQANIYIQKEQPAKAALVLEMLRRLGKANAQTLFLLGDLYMAQEARDLALAAYLEALDKDGGQNVGKALRPAQILVSRGAWDEAGKLFVKIRSAGALNAEDELKLLKLESKAAMASGQGEKAVESLEQIINKNPLDAEALLLAGDFYAKNGQRERAEFRYQSVAGMDGSSFQADALVKHAQLLVQSQKYTQALELLRKAQKIKPRDNVQRYLEKIEQLARTSHL